MTTVDVIARSPDIAPYRTEWDALYGNSQLQPSTSFEWTQALTRSHLGTDEDFRLLRLSRGGTLAGLVPLTARRMSMLGYPVIVLAPLSEHYNTHSDLLVKNLDAECVSAFISALLALDVRWDLFRMSNLLDQHPLLLHLSSALDSTSSAPQLRGTHASYFLELPESFDAYLTQRSAKFRNHLKRVEKRVDQSKSEILEFNDPARVGRGFEMLLEVERQSWKHAHGTAISAVARQASFYQHLCEGAAAAGRLHLQVMTINREPVAYNLGYVVNSCYSYLKTSYAEPFKAQGVSTYLRARLVKSLIDRRVAHLDFPAEPYEWERQWTDTARWHTALTVYRSTAVGRMISWIDQTRHGRTKPARERQVEHYDAHHV